MKSKIAIGSAAVLAMSALGAAPALAAEGDATVSVLHAVPGVTVDVYVDGAETVPDLEPGSLTEPLTLAPGAYDIQVFADGDDPATAEPAIEATDVEVPADADVTLVAYLDEGGTPALVAFVNDTTPVPAGQARLTVRHLAAAPAVDLRADGAAVVEGIENSDEASLLTAPGTVSADVVLAGTPEVVIAPSDLTLAEGTTTIETTWLALRYVVRAHERDEIIRPSDVRDLLGITTSTTTTLIDRLEARDLVRRQPHPTDRRSSRLVLDEASTAIVTDAIDTMQSSILEDAQALTDAQRDASIALLRSLIAATRASNE